MSGQSENEKVQWAAYCLKCGKCHGHQWGMEVCPDCGGKVDILKYPPKSKVNGQGITLRL